MKRYSIGLSLLFLTLVGVQSLELEAYFSDNGVRGTIRFSEKEDSKILITVDLNVTMEQFGEYSWGVYPFPIDYSTSDYCHSRVLGRKPEINFDNTLNKLVLPTDDTQEYNVTNDLLTLRGDRTNSIWGKSLVLEGPDRSRICASIVPTDATVNLVRTAEARFTSPIAGSIWFTSLAGSETKIYTNLYHTQSIKSSDHRWKIYITDLFESESANQKDSCDFLQILYDPENTDDTECSEDNPEKCKAGDLSSKFGNVKVGKKESMFTKSYHTDLHLELPELDGQRSLYLVLFDNDHPDSFLACTKIRQIKSKTAEAKFDNSGVTGVIGFEQINPFHPVKTFISLNGLDNQADGYHVHEYPLSYKRTEDFNPCSSTGGHFNPSGLDASSSPPKGEGTFEKYEVGDLSGKYGGLADRNQFHYESWDTTLTLFGPLSIIGRSIVIHKTPQEKQKRWVCANIDLTNVKSVVTAEVIFAYPIVGRIILRQDGSNPLSDTTIFVESLLYSDGTRNNTEGHTWHVHTNVPGRDFYNWTNRCASAGPHFNPYSVSLESSTYGACVNEKRQDRCEVGDLAHKHGTLKIAGRKRDLTMTKAFFTDTNLPLRGRASIIGRSIVIHDQNAPQHRGNRLACTGIRRLNRRKAVAKEWFGNGIPPPIDGRLEFIQVHETSTTHSLVDIRGMHGMANSYHVHVIPLQYHLEFPCTGEAVGGHFNPFNVDASLSPNPSDGSSDQYEVGDLSGKYGLIGDMDDVRNIYNDTNLPLFGSNSIVGRSIVVHKKFKGQRWACTTIGWGFDPDEATEVRAIASFHHPDGFAWGYIRFKQVVYRDGSSSTATVIEVRLKYPGDTNTAQTTGHDWSIYVNPVGHDAAVEFSQARCTAAGYRWNPTHIQLADPNDHGFYSEECGQDVPLRCQAGDLSGKNGRIDIGGAARVFHDENINLETGDWFTSAIGKSVVIHGANGSPERMACANIEKDTDIIKYAKIRISARFSLETFMKDVRGIMGVPEWFLFADSRKTKTIHNGKCMQIQLHFTGPQASKLEQDFSRLLRTGKLSSPSIYIPGFNPDPLRKTKLGFEECGNDVNRPSRTQNLFYNNSIKPRIDFATAIFSLFLWPIFWRNW